MVIDCICLFAWHVIETLVNVNQLKTGSSCTRLYRLVCDRYSTFLLLGVSSPCFYSQFPLLDISRYWLLHNVSYTRRIQWKALLAFLLKHSITRHFNYSAFQRSHCFHFCVSVCVCVHTLGPLVWMGGMKYCSPRNVFDSCTKSWQYVRTDNILLETSFYRSEG